MIFFQYLNIKVTLQKSQAQQTINIVKSTLVPLNSVPLISAIPLISTQFVCNQFFYLAKPLISATSH